MQEEHFQHQAVITLLNHVLMRHFQLHLCQEDPAQMKMLNLITLTSVGLIRTRQICKIISTTQLALTTKRSKYHPPTNLTQLEEIYSLLRYRIEARKQLMIDLKCLQLLIKSNRTPSLRIKIMKNRSWKNLKRTAKKSSERLMRSL